MDSIADCSFDRFGVEQARRYRDGLLKTFEMLAIYPEMGRDYGHLRRGIRRFEHEGHSIFYQPAKSGVLIIRVLGQAQLASRHLR